MGFDLQALAENLRIERAKRNLSQKEVAEKSGITQAQISSWENGSNTPTVESLFKLAMFYGKGLDELCGCPDGKIHA